LAKRTRYSVVWHFATAQECNSNSGWLKALFSSAKTVHRTDQETSLSWSTIIATSNTTRKALPRMAAL
jgi:hypothetical protein